MFNRSPWPFSLSALVILPIAFNAPVLIPRGPFVEGSLGGPKIDAFGKRTLSRIRIPKCIIDVAKFVVCFCLLVIDTCLQQLCFTHPRRSYLQSFHTNLYRFKLGGERIDTIMYVLMYVCRSVCGKPWPFLALVMIYYVGLYAITLTFSLMQFGT